MNKILLITISALLLFFVSCTKFEKYESKKLADAPTATVTTEEVKDSSVVVSFTSSSTGFISFALLEGTGNPAPDSSALIQLNTEALQLGSGEITEAGSKVMFEFAGLVQNTVYEVFAAAQNDDGVLSNVTDVVMIKTTDVNNPVLSEVTPAISNEALQAVDFEVSLVFDEPISSADVSKFTFAYFLEGAEAVAASAEVDPANPYAVIVTQSRAAHTGDYVFLSFDEGAVLDIVGNPVDAFVSGLDEEGYLSGLYWRAVKVGFDFDPALFVPENGSATSDPDFVIEFEAPVVVESGAEDGSIRLVLKGAGFTTVYDVPAANIVADDDGTTFNVYKPFTPDFGESIYIEIDAGTFTDDFGNPNNVIESGMDDIMNEDDPITEISWLISYGYSIDMIIGTYQVDGTSNWEGYDESFEVVIAQDPDDENQIIATGIYFSEVPVVGVFNGDFATITFNIPLADDGLNWIELGDLYDDGASNSLEVYGDDHFVCHIDAEGNMYTDGEFMWGSYYYLDADNAGWNNLFVFSTWTKAGDGINIRKDLKSKYIPKNFK